MNIKRVCVTGANGFIGKALLKSLSQNGYEVIATVRSPSAYDFIIQYCQSQQLSNVTPYDLGELSNQTHWEKALNEVDLVIHCAARAHILSETSDNPLQSFREVNRDGTIHLAEEAIKKGVKRFIYLSSIGVLGNTSKAYPFRHDSLPNPQYPYALSKLEAEETLLSLNDRMDIVIIRPPMVYGPDVKGNFQRLVAFINKGLPLPLGSVNNQRSFIGVNNLVDLILCCIQSKMAANQILLAADKEVVSTTEFIRLISKALNKKNILLPIPQSLLNWVLKKLGRQQLAEQLLGNLEVDITHTKSLLQWEPPYSMYEQLQEIAPGPLAN